MTDTHREETVGVLTQMNRLLQPHTEDEGKMQQMGNTDNRDET